MGRDLLANQQALQDWIDGQLTNLGLQGDDLKRLTEYTTEAMNRMKDLIQIQLEIERLRTKEQTDYMNNLKNIRSNWETLMDITDLSELLAGFKIDRDKIIKEFGGMSELTEQVRLDLLMTHFDLEKNIVVEHHKKLIDERKRQADEEIEVIKNAFDSRKNLMRAQLQPILDLESQALRLQFAAKYRGAGGQLGLQENTMDTYRRKAENLATKNADRISQEIAKLQLSQDADIAAAEETRDAAILQIEKDQHDALVGIGNKLIDLYDLTEMFNNTLTKLLVGSEKPTTNGGGRQLRPRYTPGQYRGNPSAITRDNFNPNADKDKRYDNLVTY
jgi:hypothetical protein